MGQAVERGAMAAWADLLRFHSRVTDVLEHELVAGADLPLTWYDVLLQLSLAPEGRLRMQDLAQAVVLSRSGLTRVVDRLERAGLVERTSCPSDRRGLFAEVTPAGKAVLRKAKPVHLRGIAAHFSSVLDEDEVAALGPILAKLLAALD